MGRRDRCPYALAVNDTLLLHVFSNVAHRGVYILFGISAGVVVYEGYRFRSTVVDLRCELWCSRFMQMAGLIVHCPAALLRTVLAQLPPNGIAFLFPPFVVDFEIVLRRCFSHYIDTTTD